MHTLRQAAPGSQTDLRPGCAATEFILPAVPASAGEARRIADATLGPWGIADASSVVAVTSELVANAVREEPHGRREEVLLRLNLTVNYVIVQVGDRNPAAPPRPPRHVPAGDESGRGLPIAHALSRRLCWYSERGWKIVWAAIPRGSAGTGRDTWTLIRFGRDTWTRLHFGRAA